MNDPYRDNDQASVRLPEWAVLFLEEFEQAWKVTSWWKRVLWRLSGCPNVESLCQTFVWMEEQEKSGAAQAAREGKRR